MILAGDIGGTKTRLAIYRVAGDHLELHAEASFPSRDHDGLESVIAAFRALHPGEVRQACFGIAGPVRDGRSQVTNLPWRIDARELARTLRLVRVDLINDLEANAYGIAALSPGDLVELQAGAPPDRTAKDKPARAVTSKPPDRAATSMPPERGATTMPPGNVALIAAGTGLGEAGLYWDGAAHRPFGTEGGHASFAPADLLQEQLLAHLRRTHEHVSWERVLSGPGLYNVYLFLRDTGRGEEEPWLRERLAGNDPSSAISSAALEGRSRLCEQALDLFVSLYGAEAGNLALKIMAVGGVYVGGGIAPKILSALKGPLFMRAFLAKGRMKELLSAMPVRVILNDRTALVGAARCAALRAGQLSTARKA